MCVFHEWGTRLTESQEEQLRVLSEGRVEGGGVGGGGGGGVEGVEEEVGVEE